MRRRRTAASRGSCPAARFDCRRSVRRVGWAPLDGDGETYWYAHSIDGVDFYASIQHPVDSVQAEDSSIRIPKALIRAAVSEIPAQFQASPHFVHDGLSEVVGATVVVKVETTNPLGSFKGRGAFVAMNELVRAQIFERYGGVVVASTGNFGAAVAYAARTHDISTTVLVPPNANSAKRQKLLRLDAHVVEAPRHMLKQYAEEKNLYPLIDGVNPHVSIGAGTIALELTEAIVRGELPSIDRLYVPVGDGALISGIGSWLTESATEVVGVVSEAAPSMALSWKAGKVITTDGPGTYADGISVTHPHPEALDRMRPVVNDMRIVTELQLRTAQIELGSHLGLTPEGAAAAGWAGAKAAIDEKQCIGIIITGANIRPSEVSWMPLGDEKSRR